MRLPNLNAPVQATGIRSVGVIAPVSSPMAAVASFQGEPGGYVPMMARL